jgi:protein associated with RNAse G/E
MSFSSIKSFKHDGSSHRMWMYLTFLKEDEDFYYLAAQRAKVIEDDGREWRAPEGALYLLSKHRFYNVIVMFCYDRKMEYYVNIASPTIAQNGVYEFIDYDLDLKKDGSGHVKEIDWGEYSVNLKTYGYSPELQEVLVKTLKETEALLKEGAHPFADAENKELFDSFLASGQLSK